MTSLDNPPTWTTNATNGHKPNGNVQLAQTDHEPLTPTELLDELTANRKAAQAAGSKSAIDRQHERGKLLARDRLDRLFDPDTFVEIGLLARAEQSDPARKPAYGDGVITGWGLVDGRKVFAYAQDFTVVGGSMGHVHGRKVAALLELAESVGAPVVAINDGGGARIQEGVAALAAYGQLFRRNVRLSGVVPQISLIFGPCAGGAVYSPAVTDLVYMVEENARMFITGPEVVAQVTGEVITAEDLGGPKMHAHQSGVATFGLESEDACIEHARNLLSFLPSNHLELPPAFPTSDEPDRRCEGLRDLLPDRDRIPYDARQIITELTDHDEEPIELFHNWAPNVICTLTRLDGHPVGFVANQPAVLAGALDIDASEKAARFVRFCDAFNIPLIAVVDVPGFLPGVDQERNGIIRRGASLLYAFCEATVPRIQLIVRKAHGGAYIVMNSKSVGADLAFAWPTAQIAVMGAEAAVAITHRRTIGASNDPDQTRSQLAARYTREFETPYPAVEGGHIDDVIDPADTRRVLIQSLAMLQSKREKPIYRKHGNMPI